MPKKQDAPAAVVEDTTPETEQAPAEKVKKIAALVAVGFATLAAASLVYIKSRKSGLVEEEVEVVEEPPAADVA